MKLFITIFAALIGALAPPTGHATARAILTVLGIFTIGLSTVVKGADVLVGKCTPGRCDTKKHTDVYWDASGRKTSQINDQECHVFVSYVNAPLYLGDTDCDTTTKVLGGACVNAPPPSFNFHLVCPVPTSELAGVNASMVQS